jgi:hypothetical protein
MLVLLLMSTTVEAGEWRLTGGNDGYVMETSDAAVTLRNDRDTTYGSASTEVPAEGMRARRVTLSADVETRGVTQGATLTLVIKRGNGSTIGEHDLSVYGDTSRTRRGVTLPVPDDATAIAYGVSMHGGGTITARNLRLETSPWDMTAPPSREAGRVLEAAIAIVRNNALRRREVNWNEALPRVRTLAAGARQSSEVYAAIGQLLSELGDRHSFVMKPGSSSAARVNRPAEARALPNGIGYVEVPGYLGGDTGAMRAWTKEMHDALAATDAPCGWIVDVRANLGGTPLPMLAGLKPFLGSAGVGANVPLIGKPQPWVPGFGVNMPPPASLRALRNAPVAVLTGPWTASAGELVAIAFRGRADTRSFGQPTAGVSTANSTYRLPDGGRIVLTTAVMADRRGNSYGSQVPPDEITEGDEATLAAAMEWLKRTCSR